jgi:hypothetical protein
MTYIKHSKKGPSPQDYSLCAIEVYTLANQDIGVLKDDIHQTLQEGPLSTRL